MIKRYIFLIVLFFSSIASAAEFTASVSESEIAYNDTFQLSLQFNGGGVKSSPDIKLLEPDFEVLGRSNASSTSIINGDVTTSKEWIYTLKPKKKGDITIPAISINAESKTIKSQPVKIKVVAARALPQRDSNSGIFLESSVTKQDPYQREPIILSLKLYSLTEATNITVSKVEVPETIVQQIGNYNTYRATKGNLSYDVIEWKFNITPTKPGRVKIPGFEVRGVYSPRGNAVRVNIFNDPFANSISRGMIPGSMKSFRLAFNEVILNVKEAKELPSKFKDAQWLPAKSISLMENWDSDEFIQGRPIKRSVIMNATGVLDSQLPKIAMKDSDDYKSYADPEVKTVKFDNDIISSSRTDYFTIIPTKSGKIEFPEIVIPYWNVDNDRLEEARLPAKLVTVQAATASGQVNKIAQEEETYKSSSEIIAKSSIRRDPDIETETETDIGKEQDKESQSNMLSYLVMILGIAAAGVVIYVVFKRRNFMLESKLSYNSNDNKYPENETILSNNINRNNINRNSQLNEHRVLSSHKEMSASKENDISHKASESKNVVAGDLAKQKIEKISKRKKPVSLKISQISKLNDMDALHKFLQDYAYANWGMQANCSLEAILLNLKANYPDLFAKNEDASSLYKKVTSSIYKHLYYRDNVIMNPAPEVEDRDIKGHGIDDVMGAKADIVKLIKSIDRSIAASKPQKKLAALPKLNPY